MYDMRQDRSRSAAGSIEARLTALEARVLDLEASLKQQRICLKWWNRWRRIWGKWLERFVWQMWAEEIAYHDFKRKHEAVDDSSVDAVATPPPAGMGV